MRARPGRAAHARVPFSSQSCGTEGGPRLPSSLEVKTPRSPFSAPLHSLCTASLCPWHVPGVSLVSVSCPGPHFLRSHPVSLLHLFVQQIFVDTCPVPGEPAQVSQRDLRPRKLSLQRECHRSQHSPGDLVQALHIAPLSLCACEVRAADRAAFVGRRFTQLTWASPHVHQASLGAWSPGVPKAAPSGPFRCSTEAARCGGCPPLFLGRLCLCCGLPPERVSWACGLAPDRQSCDIAELCCAGRPRDASPRGARPPQSPGRLCGWWVWLLPFSGSCARGC